MNAAIRILTIAVLLLSAILSAAAKTKFDTIGGRENFNYTYISPAMLKAMSGTIDSNGYTLDTDNLTSVETISTLTDGTNKEFWDAIRSVIKEENLETLSTNKNYYTRFDMLGKINSAGNITHLMLIQQNGGNQVTVTYLIGDIPVKDFNFGF